MKLKWHVYRDCDTIRLRKVVVECWLDGAEEFDPRDKRRMFAWPFFEFRVKRKMKRMAKLVEKMLIAEKKGIK